MNNQRDDSGRQKDGVDKLSGLCCMPTNWPV